MKALGLMSGTSLDGIDAAVIDTDGEQVFAFGPALTIPYADDFRERLRGALAGGAAAEVERELTLLHVEAVKRLPCEDVELIGFHGHTAEHRPADGVTRQIGDGALLAKETGITVICDFRSNDVAAGGEGAPLVPLFHAALAHNLKKPLAVLNIGGVANVTWMGAYGELLAFDTGPGNALIDDWLLKTTGRPMDEDGALARFGRADEAIVAGLSAHPYFNKPPPKSLDRNDFNAAGIGALSPADGAATLTAFTVQAVIAAVRHFPAQPERWLVCGGGRRNKFLMYSLNKALGGKVEAAEAAGWNGDALEAQAFAYLAVRSLKGLPLSLPATTGVARPTTGGVMHRP